MGGHPTAVVLFSLVAACADAEAPQPRVVVVPPSLRLYPGGTGKLTDAGGGATASWRSSAPTIATVDPIGTVSAVALGTTTVWAVRGTDSSAASVEVVRGFCAGAPTAFPAGVIIVPGDTARVEASDGCGRPGNEFTWSSSDTTVAAVELRPALLMRAVGLVRARGIGQAVVSARSAVDSTVNVSIAVTVRLP